MGNTKSLMKKKLRRKTAADLREKTNMTEKDLNEWYSGKT